MIQAVFFDLDGTLLPMDEKFFTKLYMKEIAEKLMPYGYEADKLVSSIMNGLVKMVSNTSSRTNEEVFWESFSKDYPSKNPKKDLPIFTSFYLDEFKKTKEACKENPLAKEIVSFCRKHLKYTVLSTNPIFPREAQETRLSFIGLKDTDFDYVTDYSNSCSCKPNPSYFKTLLEKFSLKPDEVLLFGNDVVEDVECGASLGIQGYLIDGCILTHGKEKNDYPIIKMEDVIPTIKAHLKSRYLLHF